MGKKTRLGTGLDSLFEDNFVDNSLEEEKTDEASVEDSVAMVKLSLLEPNKDQPRGYFDENALNELADSIKENGVLQPILVRPLENGGYQIVAGERRWRASRLAGLTEVPVYIKELTDKQTMQMALIENIQRKDLTPIEEANAYKSLMDSYGMTQQQVAEAVGRSRSAVANSLRLLNLDDDVQELIEDGILMPGHAKILAGLDLPAQIAFAVRAKDEGMSVRELEALVSDYNKRVEEANQKGEEKIKKRSVKKERPFLREFEFAVNNNSNVRVKTKSENDGGVSLNLKIGKEMDIENILKRLAEVLEKY